jgi:hypothetical protein
MNEETIRATEDPSADQQLIVGYCKKLKTRTQDNGESLQEVATAIRHLTHHAFPACHETHVHEGSGKAFGNGTRDRGVKQQLRLGRKRTQKETLRRTLQLEIIKIVLGSSIKLRK